jgi:hypothetical protein
MKLHLEERTVESIILSSSCFWAVRQRWLVAIYRRLGWRYRSHFRCQEVQEVRTTEEVMEGPTSPWGLWNRITRLTVHEHDEDVDDEVQGVLTYSCHQFEFIYLFIYLLTLPDLARAVQTEYLYSANFISLYIKGNGSISFRFVSLDSPIFVVLTTLFMFLRGLYLSVPDFREQQAVLIFDLTNVSFYPSCFPPPNAFHHFAPLSACRSKVKWGLTSQLMFCAPQAIWKNDQPIYKVLRNFLWLHCFPWEG